MSLVGALRKWSGTGKSPVLATSASASLMATYEALLFGEEAK